MQRSKCVLNMLYWHAAIRSRGCCCMHPSSRTTLRGEGATELVCPNMGALPAPMALGWGCSGGRGCGRDLLRFRRRDRFFGVVRVWSRERPPPLPQTGRGDTTVSTPGRAASGKNVDSIPTAAVV